MTCLDDEDFRDLEYDLARGLFSSDFKFAQTNTEFTRKKIISFIAGENERARERAIALHSRKGPFISEGIK